MNLIDSIGRQVKTSWGNFKIGQEVYFSKEVFNNLNYEKYFDKKLIIKSADTENMDLGVNEPVFDFYLENNEEFPFKLQGYAISKTYQYEKNFKKKEKRNSLNQKDNFEKFFKQIDKEILRTYIYLSMSGIQIDLNKYEELIRLLDMRKKVISKSNEIYDLKKYDNRISEILSIEKIEKDYKKLRTKTKNISNFFDHLENEKNIEHISRNFINKFYKELFDIDDTVLNEINLIETKPNNLSNKLISMVKIINEAFSKIEKELKIKETELRTSSQRNELYEIKMKELKEGIAPYL
jgi:hypothetical protein